MADFRPDDLGAIEFKKFGEETNVFIRKHCYAELEAVASNAGQLLIRKVHDPIACWMEHHVEVQNAPAGMFDNEEAASSSRSNSYSATCGSRRRNVTSAANRSCDLL